MHGDQRIKQILDIGKYSFNPLTDPMWRCSNWRALDVARKRAGQIRLPRRVRVENLTWRRSQGLDWTMHLPMGSKVISVPVVLADDASLGYYNCRLIEPNDIISLHHRSIIVDFCYQQGYFEDYVLSMRGGCSIEQHDFAHVDMPLETPSGYLVIGKIDPVDDALELTAFAVKPHQRVYIPAQTIHTNDYLLGKWETLLSSSCIFPSAQIRPAANASDDHVHEYALPLLAFDERHTAPQP